jgi:predicted RND superfamily exporter protein
MKSVAEQWAALLRTHTRAVIAVLLLATVVIGAGVPLVEDETDISQFESQSPAVNASTFIGENFVPEGGENRTTIQVIRRGEEGENVLTREELLDSLEFQQSLRAHPEIGPTLVEDEPMTGVGNVLALYHIQQVLGGLDAEGVAAGELAALDDDEREALAGLLGFEGESAQTVVELFGVLSESDAGETPDPGNLTELDNETVAAIAASQGFENESEQQTVVELVAVLGSEEPPVGVSALSAASDEEVEAAATLLGIDTLPPEDCLDALAAREQADVPRQQQQPPPLSCQVWALQEMDNEEFEAAIAAVLGPDGQTDALALVPQSYEPGSTSASAHNIFISQRTEGGSLEDPEGFGDRVRNTQLELRRLAENRDRTYLMFGAGVLNVEIDQSLNDSTALVGPIAFLFVVLVLTAVYRDLFDILLGMGGIVAVLIWLFGFMGWTGIAFNQLMISVPVLLIGLSIDFALHVFMRHREQHDEETDVRAAMGVALAGVVVALAWVTATTAIGFLSNLVSPIAPLREFGMASAFGIFAALAVFGALVPAVKIELDEYLVASGRERNRTAFGTGDSRLSRLLELGAVAARRAPVAVVVAALVLSGVGVYGATQVDTSFQEEDFLADDPPDWTQRLPDPFGTSEYSVTQDLSYLNGNFQQVGREGELLIRGDVTDDRVLGWLAAAAENASEQETVYTLPNGESDVRSPLTAIRATARLNPDSAFNERLDGYDGIPAENVSGLYDGMTAINPAASEVVHAESEEYEAIRMQVGVLSGISQEDATADLRQIADFLESVSGGELEVIATGDLIVNTEVERNLLQTVTESLIITLVSVFLFLVVAYRLTGNAASLGVVTLLPVLFAVSWILGTMWLVGMPFNALTGTIAALTIGLGIDYSIHVSDRYEQELHRQEDVWAALQTTVTGTGGALLGTAATTVGGFGTLVLAILPALRQFGIITGLTIVYAFLASVLVLPSMLVLWTRYLGPDGYFPDTASVESEASTNDPATTHDD